MMNNNSSFKSFYSALSTPGNSTFEDILVDSSIIKDPQLIIHLTEDNLAAHSTNVGSKNSFIINFTELNGIKEGG
jgi:hypothetical protein